MTDPGSSTRCTQRAQGRLLPLPPGLGLAAACQQRLRAAGEAPRGWKIGFTNRPHCGAAPRRWTAGRAPDDARLPGLHLRFTA